MNNEIIIALLAILFLTAEYSIDSTNKDYSESIDLVVQSETNEHTLEEWCKQEEHHLLSSKACKELELRIQWNE